jgi:primosomal protein N' (replication factor Y) (superfamily II helicase)
VTSWIDERRVTSWIDERRATSTSDERRATSTSDEPERRAERNGDGTARGASGALISVAVPVATLPLLTYRVPPELAEPARGTRVLVPLGRRTVTAIVVGRVEGPRPAGVRDVLETLDEEPFLPSQVVDLGLWVSDYYLSAPGEALGAAVPPFAWIESEKHYQLTEPGQEAARRPDAPRLLRALADGPRPLPRLVPAAAERAMVAVEMRALQRQGLVSRVHMVPGRSRGFRTEAVGMLTPAGLSLAVALAGGESPPPRVGQRQRAAIEALASTPQGLSAGGLRERSVDLGAVRRLAARGLAIVREERRERDPFADMGPEAPVDEGRLLTEEQQTAFTGLARLLDDARFHTAVLHGVTGSGKTEIYLRLAGRAIQQGRRALILVPEIALTPQAASHFRAAFRDRVAIQHSALADGERHDQWHRIRRGEVDVVVGTRSAVFAPVDCLGLIVVDEEHDTSYKQEESPRYHGRDVAVVRARAAGALVVLGSATPALETYYNAETGRYSRMALERRVLDRPLAVVSIVDMREEYAVSGPDVVLSRALIDALGSRAASGEQALLLLNRRGFATTVFCRQCGHVLDCPNCSVSLTVHHQGSSAARGVCHYCNYSVRVPSTCAKCAAPYLEQSGFGTERVEAEVERVFPNLRVGRVDRDTMRKRGAVGRLLSAFGRGELDLLVGTQMIAKGHDFPRVTLVGVVSADIGLGLADFRAAERTFQLLTQVAGRAGRGDRTGQAIIQTLNPDHYSIRLACRQDYAGFFREELRYRKAMRYPPIVGLVNVIVRGRSLGEAMGNARDLVAALPPDADRVVLGPAPAPLTRLRGEYRAQFLLKSRERGSMRRALAAALAAQPDLTRRTTVDVDPIGML